MKKTILLSAGVLLCGSLLLSAFLLGGAFRAKFDVTVVSTPVQSAAETPERFAEKTVAVKRPSGKNLALNQEVKSNGITEVYLPKRAVDGKTVGTSYWEGSAQMPNILTVTLKEPQEVGLVLVALNPNSIWSARKQTFSVQTSEDGAHFSEAKAEKEYSFDPQTGNYVTVPLDKAKKVKSVQLTFTKNTGAKGAQVAELELYASAN